MRGVSGSTAQPHLYLGDLRALLVPVPPLAEQAEIVAEVDRRLSVADAAETQVEHALQRAARLRQAILKRAFEGKLVPQDPTDEPAAALLEQVNTRGSGDSSKTRRAVIRIKDDDTVVAKVAEGAR
jgi:type I restriction enzyme S subunit